MLTTTNVYQLSFLTNMGETLMITIPRADTAKTAQAVANAMSSLISCGVVLTGKGVPVQSKKAEIVTTVTEDLAVA